MQSVTFDYETFAITLESGVFGNYMSKTGPEVRFGKVWPTWRLDSTRIEIYGTEGLMYLEIMGGGWQVFDDDGKIRDEHKGYFPDENHQKNFIESIRSNKTPNADIVEGHKSATLIHLANLAYRTGNKLLYYNGKKGIIENSEEANEISRGYYRPPYLIPEVI